MCRIEEKIYFRRDGHQSVFQEPVYCEKGRRRGKLCSDAKFCTTKYHDPASSPIPSSPLTPRGPPHQTQTNQPSTTSSRPSTRDGPVAIKPELIIEIGSKKGKVKGYPTISIHTKGNHRSSMGSSSAIDSPGSESSYTARTGYPEAALPPLNSGRSRSGSFRPAHRRNLSSDEFYTGSSRVPSLYWNSDDYDTPSLATTASSGNRPIVHNGQRQVPSPINTTLGQSGSSPGSYRTTVVTPSSVYSGPSSRTERNNRTGASHAGSEAVEITGRAEDRERRRQETRRQQEALDREVAATLMREEKRKVYFEPSHAQDREEQRAEKIFAGRADERGRLLRQLKKEREAQSVRDTATKRPKPQEYPPKPSAPSRRSSTRMTFAEVAKQKQLIEAEVRQMRDERAKAEAVEWEENMQQQQPILLQQLETDAGTRRRNQNSVEVKQAITAEQYINSTRGDRGTYADQPFKIARKTSSRLSSRSQVSESLPRGKSVPQALKRIHLDIEEALVTVSETGGDLILENADKNEQNEKSKLPLHLATNVLHSSKTFRLSDSKTVDDIFLIQEPSSPSSPLHQYASHSSNQAEQEVSDKGGLNYPLEDPQDTLSNVVYIIDDQIIVHDPPKDIDAVLTQGEAIEAHSDDLADDDGSTIPSYAASVFTVESLASSASALSDRGYSAEQIATATRRLVVIVSEDDQLVPLYQNAIENTNIGPDRLRRNLRRFFKVYADNLAEEGEGRLEFLTSRLVANKARYLAEYIVEKFQSHLPLRQVDDRKQQDESSDDEEKVIIVHEDMFHDLKVFGEFLVGSAAFSALRAQVQSFVLTKVVTMPYNLEVEAMSQNQRKVNHNTVKVRTWRGWFEDARRTVDAIFLEPKDTLFIKNVLVLAADVFCLVTDSLFIRFDLLEPPLGEDMTRIRWNCRCGDVFFSDVKEHREKGISDLVTYMERSTGTKASATPYNHQPGNQRYIAPQPIQRLKNACRKLSSIITGSNRAVTGLPQHNSQTSVAGTCASTSSGTTLQSSLHLMACIHRNRTQKILQQDRLENISTDRDLLYFLRQQYSRHRGRILTMLSFKSVQGSYLVKFNLPMGTTVIVRDHNPHCVGGSTSSSSCECIPPKSKVEPPNAEYDCVPGPPATYPPVPSEHLLMLLTCPSYAHESDDWIYKQLPKHMLGELQGKPGQPAEGWGIYYKEGWDSDMIIFAVFVVMVIASLLFGVLWSKYKFDVQGAFGVAAYMIAVCAIMVPMIAMRVEKMR